MMHVIKDVQVFGKVACFKYSIEWQKRGLPHMHLLVCLQTKIHPEQVDSIISAEIPDKEENHILYEVVTKNMIHDPFCNRNRKALCIVEGKCSKRFRRQMLQEIQTGNDGYPLYRQRKPGDGGHVAPGRALESGMLENVCNSWVVPYSPLLCRIFKAHINVEYCNSVKSIKYICKFVTKGVQEYAYKSTDCILNDDEAGQYPIEFLNSIQIPDLQAHNLILKVGAPIMLIRNIDAPRLCNGTRLIVKKLMQHVIQATVLTGCAKGKNVFIPRIPVIPSDNTIQFKRIQFSLKLCFVMTINKSHGQSFGIAGIELQTPCFSHGQLYVACSRVGKEENLFVHSPNGTAKNVVYHIALR
ncbi:ATP-dependent DNA helicase [Trichonephila clavipes]|nr:ATP-dependent DNA helicase [Trichonephila clavipes]